MQVRPLPDSKGLGFFSTQSVEGMGERGYRHEKVEISGVNFYNYYFTPKSFRWPFATKPVKKCKVDGFSPNLNKDLHVGHLRNLALANAFSKMWPEWDFVSIFGTSLGRYQKAVDALVRWFDFLDFNPTWYYDSLMPWDEEIVPRQPGTGKNAGAMVWISPEKNEVVVMRSNLTDYICTRMDGDSFYLKEGTIIQNCPICGLKGLKNTLPSCLNRGKSTVQGRPNYVFHDIAFAATVGPDYYLTGAEQVDHFRMLGLGEKHLPMGLVCGTDGKKLKSRSGDALSADEAMGMVESRLDKTPEPRKLAWNIIAWNFLHVNREQNVRFDPVTWTAPDSPGLYIAYTFARLHSALANIPTQFGGRKAENPINNDAIATANVTVRYAEITDLDLSVLGYSEYAHYWHARALESMDLAGFANYVHDLCRALTTAYNTEKIVGGRIGFQAAMTLGTSMLGWCMKKLGMFPLTEV